MKLLTFILVGSLFGASLQAAIISKGIVKIVEGIAIPIDIVTLSFMFMVVGEMEDGNRRPSCQAWSCCGDAM